MNYQHFYHAGNPADVFKHLTLLSLVDYFQKKTKPFCIIDTHAGEGEYMLSVESHKEHEWQKGVGILLKKKISFSHPLIQKYAQLQNDLNHFHGSPAIVRRSLRVQDQLILIEKADKPFQSLKRKYYYDKQVHIHHLDAQIGLKSLLPPAIKRGIIFIDPIYEEINEHTLWLNALKTALTRFPNGCYALWYPIKSREKIQTFYKQINSFNIAADKLILEFCPLPDDVGLRFNGSGILLINPPFEFEKNISPILEELILVLKQHEKGFQKCFYMV